MSSPHLPPSSQVSQPFLDNNPDISLDIIGYYPYIIGYYPSKIGREVNVSIDEGRGGRGGREQPLSLTAECQLAGAGHSGHPQAPVSGSAGPAGPRLPRPGVHPVPLLAPDPGLRPPVLI